MNDKTINDAIEWLEKILENGGVSGTDFELNEDETELIKFTISCLKLLKLKCCAV